MRRNTLAKAGFAVAFVTACSSSSGIVSQAIEGGPGQEIVVSIAGVETGGIPDREGGHEYEVQDHLFIVRVTGRLMRAFRPEESHVVDVRCIVALANGDSYFYTFEGPVHEFTP